LSCALHLGLAGTAGLELSQHLGEPHNTAPDGCELSKNAPIWLQQ